MGRFHTVYLETPEDRKAFKAEEDAEFGKRSEVSETPVALPTHEPEYESLEAFVEYLLDDDRTEFNLADVKKLQENLRMSPNKVIHTLTDEWGLTYLPPSHAKHIRGFSNPSLLPFPS